MLKWLWRLVWGEDEPRCEGCEWEIMREVMLVAEGYEHPVGVEYHMKCKKCGDIKRKKF